MKFAAINTVSTTSTSIINDYRQRHEARCRRREMPSGRVVTRGFLMAAPTLKFDEVVNLVNFSRTARIEPEPTERDLTWDIYKGAYRVHASQFPFRLLYLHARNTKE